MAQSVFVTEQMLTIAEQSGHILQVDIAGVDILESKNDPVVIEFNSSGGLVGLEQVLGKDIAAEVIQYVTGKMRNLIFCIS